MNRYSGKCERCRPNRVKLSFYSLDSFTLPVRKLNKLTIRNVSISGEITKVEHNTNITGKNNYIKLFFVVGVTKMYFQCIINTK